MTTTNDVERSFTLTRLLDAPRELVFQAWTDPDHLQWFTGTVQTPRDSIKVDLRVGGLWSLLMIEREGKAYPTGGIYRAIDPPARLAFTWGTIDGWPQVDPANPDDGLLVTVTLDEVDGKTEMQLRVDLPAELTQAEVQAWLDMGIRGGWGHTVDSLVRHFAGTTA